MNYFLIGICLIIALIGCRKDDVTPTVTTSTRSVGTSEASKATSFAASEWHFFVSTTDQSNPNQYESSLLTEGAISTSPMNLTLANSYSYSLGIGTTIIKDTDVFSYWVATIIPPKGLQVGKSLTLKAKVKLQDVKGQGISIALRGDRSTQSDVLFVTTQGKVNLIGTSDFIEYSVLLPYKASVDYIDVYLILLPQTTGKVLFKDISVQVS